MWASLKYGVFSAFIASIFVAAVAAQNTYAADSDWTTKDANVEFADDNGVALNSVANSSQPCLQQEVSTFNTATQEYEPMNACVHFSSSVRLARITKCVTVFGNFCIDRSWEAASFGGDSHMYRVENLPEGTGDNCWQTTTSSSRLVYSCNSNTYVVENIYQYITRKVSSVGEVYYEFDVSGAKPYLDTAGNPVRMYALEVSRNGRWAVAEVMNVGLVRIDLGDGSMKLFTKDVRWYGYGSDPTYHFSITDDGKYIAVAGMNVGANIYRLSDSCGDDAPVFKAEWKQANVSVKECPYKDLVPELIAANGGSVAGFGYLSKIAFNDDAGQLVGYYQPYRYVNGAKAGWVTITAEGYVPAPRLDYLALGDSYSSGEGDTQRKGLFGKKYYREFTNIAGNKALGIPQEMCHVSTRSYPYLIAGSLGLGKPGPEGSTLWQSVACSGATGQLDYDINSDYLGQGDRLGETPLKETFSAEALPNYIPGRISQFMFISRNLPKSVTITAGGNDVGFGPIIKKCAQPGTCDYAQPGKQLKTLAASMQSQQKKLAQLYTQIHNLSPNTRIYVLGYPQFISKGNSCGWNVQLDGQERSFVRQAVSYMNDIIEAAANDAGVAFVDIDNSIDSHGLCGKGDIYVSGINRNCIPWIEWSSTDDCQESFHPNHLGNLAMANSFMYNIADLRKYDYCENKATVCPHSKDFTITVPPLFQQVGSVDTSHQETESEYKTVALNDSIQKHSNQNLHLHIEDLEPNAEASISLASDPISLGSVFTSQDGILDATVELPDNVPAGSHTLYVDTATYSGEPIQLWQIVTVYGENADKDEDGIPDSRDACLFVTPAGVDADGDGIDDGCDVTIGSVKDVAGHRASHEQSETEDSQFAYSTDYAEDRLQENAAKPNRESRIYEKEPGKVKGISVSNNHPNTPTAQMIIILLALTFVTSSIILYTKRRRKKL